MEPDSDSRGAAGDRDGGSRVAATPQMMLDPAEEATQRAVGVPIPEENDARALKAKAKKHKGSKELSSKSFNDAECTALDQSDAKEFADWHDKEAHEEPTEKDGRGFAREAGTDHPGRARVVRTTSRARRTSSSRRVASRRQDITTRTWVSFAATRGRLCSWRCLS